MSVTAEQRERARRQRVLQQLNAQPMVGSRSGLGVSGSKVALQPKGVHLKPSKIPRPDFPASRPLPPPGYVAESILLGSPLPAGHSRQLVSSNLDSSLSITSPNIPNPWQETGDKREPNEGVHPKIAAKGPPTSSVPQKSHSRLVVKTESQQPVVGVGVATKQQPSSKDKGSAARPKEAVVLRSGPHVVSERRTRRIPSPVKRRGEKAVAKGAKGGLQPRRSAEAREERRKAVGLPYNWSKGGRLNELKIRYLARKYFRLWTGRVFGRVLPSTVRLWREASLRRKVFAVWLQEWWEVHREWKLSIRADCHNRYRLWQLVWKAWTEYVVLSKEKKRRNEIARRLAALGLKRLAWRQWQEYVRMRREKAAVNRGAVNWASGRMLRLAWLKWQRSLAAKRQFCVMDSVALHHWAFKLQKRSWSCWVSRCDTRKLMEQKSATATHHHRCKLLGACWGAWVVYVDSRRRESQMRGAALEYWSASSLVKHFSAWRFCYLRARQIAQFQEVVEEKGRRGRLRRTFTHWKYYIELRHHRSYQLELASLHHSLSLKAKAFHTLRNHAERQLTQAANKALAQQFYIKTRVWHSWSLWLQRCEHCEEIKMLPLTRRARSHHNFLLLRKVLAGWKSHTLWRRHRKGQHSIADEHFKTKALPRYFATWQEFVTIQQYKHDLRESAEEFRRETLLSMVFYKWWRASSLSQDLRMLERVAILHHEEVLKRQALEQWRAQERERARWCAQEQAAVLHRRRRLLCGAFIKWRLQGQDALKSAHQCRCALQHHSLKRLRTVWCAWTRYVTKKRLSHQRCSAAMQHYQKIMKVKVLQAWKTHHARAQEKNAKRQQALQIYQLFLKRRLLAQWRVNVHLLKSQRAMEEEAVTRHSLGLMSKCLGLWRERAALSIEEGQKERERADEAMEQLRRAKVARLLAAWREHTNTRVVERLGELTAAQHRGRILLRRCFSSWQDHWRTGLKKMLLQRQCVWFQNTRLLSGCYSKWRVEFMRAIAMKQKSTLALWHWSQQLQRKVIAAWFLYSLNQCRKAERYAKASERYRQRLLIIGVTQWIKVASATKAQHVQIALEHQTQSAHSALQSARRCALHWRRVVRERRAGLRGRASSGSHFFPRSSPPRGTAVPRTGDPFPCTGTTELWRSLAKKLQIPDGAPQRLRPQPRRPEFLSSKVHSHHHGPRLLSTTRPNEASYCDALPRVPPPHPPSPPVLYHPSPRREHHDGSFTFLPSTCSEESLAPSYGSTPTGASTAHPPSRTMHINDSLRLQTSHSEDKTLLHGQLPSPDDRQPCMHMTPALLPPSVFEKPRPTGVTRPSTPDQPAAPCPTTVPRQPGSVRTAVSQPGLNRDTEEHASLRGPQAHGRSASMMPSGGPLLPTSHETLAGGQTAPRVSLSDPGVQTEIVRMRDELRRFHELKNQQRLLEEQVSHEDSSDHVSQLQGELTRITQAVQAIEPQIRAMATRIHQLLTQCS